MVAGLDGEEEVDGVDGGDVVSGLVVIELPISAVWVPVDSVLFRVGVGEVDMLNCAELVVWLAGVEFDDCSSSAGGVVKYGAHTMLLPAPGTLAQFHVPEDVLDSPADFVVSDV